MVHLSALVATESVRVSSGVVLLVLVSSGLLYSRIGDRGVLMGYAIVIDMLVDVVWTYCLPLSVTHVCVGASGLGCDCGYCSGCCLLASVCLCLSLVMVVWCGFLQILMMVLLVATVECGWCFLGLMVSAFLVQALVL